MSEAATSVVVTVERQSANQAAFTVDYTTADGSATAGQDYVATSGTLEFVEGQLVQELEILLLNDAFREFSQSFSVQLSNITEGFELGISTMMVNVEDNDTGVGFAGESSVRIGEDEPVLLLTVGRGSDDTAAFTVDYATLDGSAWSGQDFVAASGSLQFAEGQMSAVIEITLLNDRLQEDEEIFQVQLSSPSGERSLGVRDANTSVVYIEDNDVGVGFERESYSVREDGGIVELRVVRQTDDPAAFQVDYWTRQREALAGLDYVSTSGTLQFAEGEQAQVIEIEVVNDGQHEYYRESFRVHLQNAQGIPIALGTAEVWIYDNDPGIRFETDYQQVNEAEPLVALTVLRGSDDLGPFTVEYASASRVPPEGGDYEPVSGTLSFGQGVLSQTIEVRLSGDDSLWEGDEEFEVRLSNPSAGRSLAWPETARVVLIDGEPFAWEVIPTGEPLPHNWGWHGVTWGARQYVAVGEEWTAVSPDGVYWSGNQDSDLYGLEDVVWGNGEFVAVGASGIWRSGDGRGWERVASGPQQGLRWVSYGEGAYVVVDFEGRAWSTADLNNWTFQKLGKDLRGLAHGPSGFVITGNPGRIWRWRPGEGGWLSVGTITTGDLTGVGAGSEGYVTLANHYGDEGVITEVLRSTDGVSWTASRLEGVNGSWANVIVERPGGLIAVGEDGVLRAQSDGSRWSGSVSFYPPAEDVTFGGGGFVAADWQGLYHSEDGLLWEKLGGVPLVDVVKVGEEFFVTAIVGYGFHREPLMEVRRTRDWVNWVTETNPLGWGGGGKALAAQADKLVLSEGSTLRTREETGQWNDHALPQQTWLNGLAAGQGYWVAVGTRDDPTTGQRTAISYSSSDGAEWVMTDLGFDGILSWVEQAGEWFFTGGDDWSQNKPVNLQSRDGIEWQPVSWQGDYALGYVTYGKGRYIAYGRDRADERPLLLTSLDGLDWVPASTNEEQLPEPWSQIEFGAGLFARIGDGYAVFLSKDGLKWRRHSTPFQDGAWQQGLSYADGRFYMGAGDVGMGGFSGEGHVLTSPPLSYLGSPQTAPNGDFQVLAEAEPGHAYSLEVSEDLVNWESLGPISISSPQESVTLPRSDSNTRRRFYRWGAAR